MLLLIFIIVGKKLLIMQNTEQHLLKYAIRIPLPDVLMNRPVEHLQERPDLVDHLKETLDQMESILHDICDKNFAVASDEIHQNYIEIHFETDTDQAKFLNTWSYGYEHVKLRRPKYAVSWLDGVEA